ncbi:MAG: DegT/DnrJ/EryC1/StrS family aminotransferase [Candidatus Thermoplasmatota archaeon]|nr:DegT/DnrJ/EryC1/StrS family aminotransferase [Candidatus Thermoplasmatota archaeon]
MKVPLNRMYVDDEIKKAVIDVLESGRYVKGPRAKEMEEKFAKLVGSRFAVSCSSGSTALMLAFKALDVGPGDEVIVPSHTFIATLNGFWHYGARPRFVDIDPETFTMDPQQVGEAVNEKTAGIVPVHIYGHPADMGELQDLAKEKEIPLIGDAAQAHGSQYRGTDVGSIGDMTCYSFFPSKVVTVAGEGGMITCNDEKLHELLLALRDHGRHTGERNVSSMAGFNMRMPEILAAVGSIQLEHMNEWVERRREIAKRYSRELEGIDDLELPAQKNWAKHVYYLYVARSQRRDELREHLNGLGVSTGVHYQVPTHKMPYIENAPVLPVTERIVDEILSLPMHPLLTEEEQTAVIEGVRSFSGG